MNKVLCRAYTFTCSCVDDDDEGKEGDGDDEKGGQTILRIIRRIIRII